MRIWYSLRLIINFVVCYEDSVHVSDDDHWGIFTACGILPWVVTRPSFCWEPPPLWLVTCHLTSPVRPVPWDFPCLEFVVIVLALWTSRSWEAVMSPLLGSVSWNDLTLEIWSRGCHLPMLASFHPRAGVSIPWPEGLHILGYDAWLDIWLDTLVDGSLLINYFVLTNWCHV